MVVKLIAKAMVATVIGASVMAPMGAAFAADEDTARGTGGAAGTGLIIGNMAEETKLAHQWNEAITRSGHCPGNVCASDAAYRGAKGHAFEVMARDANNARHPRNKVTLAGKANEPLWDATKADGTKVQMKASGSKGYQQATISKLDRLGETGEVWVTKGDKAVPDPRIKQSPVSQRRIERASKATARASSTGEMIAKGGKFGGVIAAGIETVFQGFELWNKRDEGITLVDWRDAAATVAKAGACGVASGAAGAAAGTASAVFVTPVGGFAVGFIVSGVTYIGCDWTLRKVVGLLDYINPF